MQVGSSFERVETLVKFFHTPPSKTRGVEKKLVTFVAETGGSETPSCSSSSRSKSQQQPVDERTKLTRDFLKPSVSTLCGKSIAAVSQSQDTNYSHLLLTLIQLYKDQGFIKSVFSSLDSSHHSVIVKQVGDHLPKEKKLLVLCSLLTKAARLDVLSPGSAKFTENILESLVLLLDGNLVDSSSAVLLLSEIIKVKRQKFSVI